MIAALAIREISKRRNTPLRLRELKEAQAQLERASAEDEDIRHLWRISDGYPWMRDWVKEIEPTLAYAQHLDLDDSALVCWLKGLSGKDVIVERSPGTFETMEITGTYTYQDRLSDEILNEVGWVAPTTPKARNRASGQAEYSEDRMDSADDILAEWAKRIECSLRGKQRPNYGHGSTLLVSCRGLDGDLANIRRQLAEGQSPSPPRSRTKFAPPLKPAA